MTDIALLTILGANLHLRLSCSIYEIAARHVSHYWGNQKHFRGLCGTYTARVSQAGETPTTHEKA
jgi:hypothetical protein